MEKENWKSTPAALTKLSAKRLRRGWPRSKKPPLSKSRSSSRRDRVSRLLLIFLPFSFSLQSFTNSLELGDVWDERRMRMAVKSWRESEKRAGERWMRRGLRKEWRHVFPRPYVSTYPQPLSGLRGDASNSPRVVEGVMTKVLIQQYRILP